MLIRHFREVKETLLFGVFDLTRDEDLEGETWRRGRRMDTFASSSPFSLGIRKLSEVMTRTSVTTLLPLRPLPSSPSPANPRLGLPSLPRCAHFNEARGEEIRSQQGWAGLVAQL